jgi:hypothetical protein
LNKIVDKRAGKSIFTAALTGANDVYSFVSCLFLEGFVR